RRSEFAIPRREIVVETNARRDESKKLIRRRANPRLPQVTWHQRVIERAKGRLRRKLAESRRSCGERLRIQNVGSRPPERELVKIAVHRNIECIHGNT